jgi:signal transduction histidine kinase
MRKQGRLGLPWRRTRTKAYSGLQDFVSRLASRTLTILEPGERRAFLEHEVRDAFGFRSVRIVVRPEQAERFSADSRRVRDTISRVGGILQGTGKPFLHESTVRELGYTAILREMNATYALLIGAKPPAGLLLIDSSPVDRLDAAVEETLLTLSHQIAVVLENSNLLRVKLDLEHTLARQAQMVQLGEMTARIAHEIKNPLSSIKTIVQVMREDLELQTRYAADLELVNAEIDRLSASIAQLLSFAKPVPALQEKVRLRETVDSVIRFLRRDIELGKMKVSNEISERVPDVRGNASVFRDILLNLVVNAVQAGGENHRPCVWFRTEEGVVEVDSERFVLLSIEDDGPGIPKEIQEKVFLPFFTTRQRGTGLGLAIVKRSVEALGGQISLESPAGCGRGTRFLLHLPVA